MNTKGTKQLDRDKVRVIALFNLDAKIAEKVKAIMEAAITRHTVSMRQEYETANAMVDMLSLYSDYEDISFELAADIFSSREDALRVLNCVISLYDHIINHFRLTKNQCMGEIQRKYPEAFHYLFIYPAGWTVIDMTPLGNRLRSILEMRASLLALQIAMS